jgi:hypothetical protein
MRLRTVLKPHFRGLSYTHLVRASMAFTPDAHRLQLCQ